MVGPLDLWIHLRRQNPIRCTTRNMSRICISRPTPVMQAGAGVKTISGRVLNSRCRFTVPVLWDKKHETIVNNESSEIIRIFNTAFNDIIDADKAALDLYPKRLRAEIDPLNGLVYSNINSQPPPPPTIGSNCSIPQMASTERGLQHLKRRIRRLSSNCLILLTRLKRFSVEGRITSLETFLLRLMCVFGLR